jgi:hypothetical protein
MDINNITPQQLRRAADIQEKILSLKRELTQLLGGPVQSAAAPLAPAPRRRKLSPQAIANIRAGARRRWAKAHGQNEAPEPALKPKRKRSAAVRARLSALAKARWRRAKAAGRTAL